MTDHHLALRNLRYGVGEPLDAFVIRLKKLMKLAFPSQTDLAPLLFSHFLAALPHELYAAVIADGISTFDAAVSKVRNIQSSRVAVGVGSDSSCPSQTLTNVHDQSRRPSEAGSSQPTPVRRLETESSVDALTKRVAELEARLSAVTVPAQRTTPARPGRVRGDTRAPVTCFCCGRSGHVRNRCRLRHCKCFVCGGDGHVAKVCPQNQENDPGSGRQSGVNGRTQ